MTPAQRRTLQLLPVYTGLVIFGALTCVPFAWLFCAAFKTNTDIFTSHFLPTGEGFLGIGWDRLTIANFVRLFTELGLGNAMLNSIFFASVSALVATFCCALAGYALAKFRFHGRESRGRCSSPRATSSSTTSACSIPTPV
jgi:multiple sugar transport system permease protein